MSSWMCQLLSKCLLFGKSINYCCTLSLWWQNNRNSEAQSVFCSLRWMDGWSEKPKRAGVLAPGAPAGIPAPTKNVTLFYVCFGPLQQKEGSSVPADRQALWKFDCNAPPSPSLFRGIVCCSCEICIYSQNKKNVCGLTFCTCCFVNVQ